MTSNASSPPPPGRARVKGTSIRSWTSFLDEKYGSDAMPRLVARIDPDLRGIWPGVIANAWYPAEFPGQVWSELARSVLGPDRRHQDAVFREMGRFVAEDNLTNVYRFVLSLMSPTRILELTPMLWKTYFEGVEGVVAKRSPERGNAMTVVTGLESIPYIAPVVCGWLSVAYERSGARHVAIVEENWAAGRSSSSRLVFHSSWT